MAAAVWTLYAADRLLDAQSPDDNALEARHHFHRKHRMFFLAGIALACVLLAALLPRLQQEAIHLYLILGVLVFGYFVVIHATQSAHRLPKEIAVGVCFAAAVFIPTVSRNPGLRTMLLPSALLFAALCSLNCLFIYAWEHPSPTGPTPHLITTFALRHLPFFSIAVAATSAGLAVFDDRAPWVIQAALSLSAGALLLLHLGRNRRSALVQRTLADLVLLAPAVVIPLL
jgi:cell division protein FtsW (lipid II flippase)